jgi:hypothetical protein
MNANVFLEQSNNSLLQAPPGACGQTHTTGNQAGLIRYCHNQSVPGCGGR